MMKPKLTHAFCFLFLILFLHFEVSAQQLNKWVFGSLAGIDFTNPTAPVAFISAMDGFGEAAASVCDANGQLLFYTEGSLVWNRNHVLMPNGSNLTGLTSINLFTVTSSCSQGALIVPMPGNIGRYYIFSLTSVEQAPLNNAGKLYYSVVDMSLNNGLGDIVPGLKGVFMDSGLNEDLTAISGDNCKIWVLAMSLTGNIKAYGVSFSGVNLTPVISPVGIPSTYAQTGKMAPSNNGTKLVAAIGDGNLSGINGAKIFDFDRSTGTASNPIQLLAGHGGYGIAFSPDNSKLYFTSGLNSLYQYDLSLGSPAAIQASEILLGTTGIFTDIKLAPNGKIYFEGTPLVLGAINQPNLYGAAALFTSNAITLAPGTSTIFGFPNVVPSFNFSQDTIHSFQTKYGCFKNQIALAPNSITGWNYKWNDGDTNMIHSASVAGTYWVGYYSNSCSYHVDSFKVSFLNLKVENSCSNSADGKAWIQHGADTTSYSYQWKNTNQTILSTIDSLKNVPAGYYTLDIRSVIGCDTSFTFFVDSNVYVANFNADTLVCIDEAISFQNTSDPYYTTYKWLFGDGGISGITNPIYSYQHGGNYQIKLLASGPVCKDTITHNITVDEIIPLSFNINKDSICEGMNVNLSSNIREQNTLVSYSWFFNDVQSFTNNAENVQHAFDNTGLINIKLTGAFRACPSDSISKEIFVGALPHVNLGSDSTMCLDDKAILLSDKNIQAAGSKFLWNTGSIEKSIQVLHPGKYTLTITSPEGCSNSENMVVNKDCYINIPNVFTPNGDGVNDYFFPRIELSSGLSAFSMKIFNRWGQIVFQTNSLNGRGWDGKFNGKDQVQGVYVYVIDVVNKTTPEHYDGNVTLVR